VGDKLTEFFLGENVMIGLLDKTSGLMKLLYLVENGKRMEYFEFPFGDKGLGHTLPRRFNFDEPPILKSWLGVPIIINGEYIGGFSLQNWNHENAYTDSYVRILQILAGSLGEALENMRLFKAEQFDDITLLTIKRNIK